MSPEAFERVIRDALADRDTRRRERLLDVEVYRAADAACVSTIMTAAGFDPPQTATRAARRGKRTAAANQATAFGGAV